MIEFVNRLRIILEGDRILFHSQFWNHLELGIIYLFIYFEIFYLPFFQFFQNHNFFHIYKY